MRVKNDPSENSAKKCLNSTNQSGKVRSTVKKAETAVRRCSSK